MRFKSQCGTIVSPGIRFAAHWMVGMNRTEDWEYGPVILDQKQVVFTRRFEANGRGYAHLADGSLREETDREFAEYIKSIPEWKWRELEQLYKDLGWWK